MNIVTTENDTRVQMQSVTKHTYFFREEYSGLIVKGNFMTLATKPAFVAEAEWLAHQVNEQVRLLYLMVEMIQATDEKTGHPICNPDSCPTMSASTHAYYWLDNEKKPIQIPASKYIQLVQRWIIRKISDPAFFPTDLASLAPYEGDLNNHSTNTLIPTGSTDQRAPLPSPVGNDWLGKSSGFHQNFQKEIKNIYQQMMRCYAHLYHGHWVNPFWDINAYKELNTCFIHFVNVGIFFKLLSDEDMEPMKPLIDLWCAKCWLPALQKQKPQT